MDREAWQVTVHGIPRVGHGLVLSFFLQAKECQRLSEDYQKLERGPEQILSEPLEKKPPPGNSWQSRG